MNIVITNGSLLDLKPTLLVCENVTPDLIYMCQNDKFDSIYVCQTLTPIQCMCQNMTPIQSTQQQLQ